MRRKAGSSSKKKTSSRRDRKRQVKDVPVDQLIAFAETAMTSLDVERAAQLYTQAATKLQLSGSAESSILKNQSEMLIHVLEKLGECNVSIGDQGGARQSFQKALELLERKGEADDAMRYHETRSNLCLYAGQLCMEQEALETYQKGIESLEACLALAKTTTETSADETMEGSDQDNTEKSLRQKLSGAYCTVAELYLTDLCYEDNAEAECESYLEKALQIKDTDAEPLVDALQTMASLRLSQKSRQLEAVPYILRAYEKMKVGSEALATLVGLATAQNSEDGKKEEGAMELKEVDAANNLPEFEFRCQTAKLLLECAALVKQSYPSAELSSPQEDQCLSAAISILGSLLAQNDEVVEIWFLTGCAFAAKRPPLAETARFYLDRAMQMLQDVRKALEQEAKFADQEKIGEIQEEIEENQVQMEDVKEMLAELGDEEGAIMED